MNYSPLIPGWKILSLLKILAPSPSTNGAPPILDVPKKRDNYTSHRSNNAKLYSGFTAFMTVCYTWQLAASN